MTLLSILLTAFLLAAPDTSAPTGGAISLAASTKKNILVVRVGGKDVKTYPVSVGTKKFPTPSGTFRINHIVWNPAWVPPPDAKWAKGKEATKPGDKKNPMKVVKIFFSEPDYYIHGTGDEDALGGAASHGCIRMSQADAFALGRYLMDNGGAPKDNDWYAGVFSRGVSADIRLPRYVPIVIGP
ncbi:MAG TPA: L,D-transpeptidase [Thermoanaerobaculia bacterium]|jgi:lipoprotein-anchoring transpeptidase ErfK/SrfK|nr:L,D-transpeptidase [Thermoanaerobaculia bacterium]